jgi:regulator of replication initiation timing
MSALSKVFVILILLVATATAVVVAYLFAMRIDFRDKWIKEINQHYYTAQVLKAEVEAREIEVASQKALAQTLATKVGNLQIELGNKEETIKSRDSQITDMSGKFEQLAQHAEALNQNLNLLIDQTKVLQTANQQLRDVAARAVFDRQAAQTEAFDLRGQVDKLTKERDAAEQEFIKVSREYETQTRKVDELVRRGVEVNVVPLPRLQAKVRGVASDVGLVIISAGSEAGVKAGMEFTIYRGPQFVARIVIDGADRDWSKGRITLKQLDPRVGDDATNEINQATVPAAK